MLPYFRFVRGEEADKSLIYPIKYQATYLWPSGKLIEFEDLEYNPVYSKVDFSKPIGTFRHEAIQKYNSGQYEEKRAELYSFYDTLIDFLVNGSEFTAEAEKSFKDLLNVIIEPSLVPIYKVLDEKFARRFLN